ncbi:MAG: sensor domain-containing diguanylate cyclase, partial [Nitrospinae bacterium]|nr:sensor domain-containing diguanylate cyclase [Nitrospinota bacterium]
VDQFIKRSKKVTAEKISGYGAWFLWKMVEKHKTLTQEMARNIGEQEALYNTGIMLASAANTEQTLSLIMQSAIGLMEMSAGTLALYDEEHGTMQTKVVMGFEKTSTAPVNFEWKVRPKGLTNHILSSERPTVIEDISKESTFDTAPLLQLGIRSLIAVPLKVEGKIMGILYVDDFTPRKFTEREINTLNLLAAQAAAAIDKAILLDKAETLAVTDELTKLYNHRYFLRTLEKEIKRAKRYGDELTLLMIDVDYFKNYNDTWGHLKGNLVLKTVADILSHSARESDIVARYGGEEFSVIISNAEEGQAAIVAERIRQEVYDHPFPGEEKQPGGKLTISVGLATFPFDGNEPTHLIECADKALYRSKALGRNIVTAFRKTAHEPAPRKKAGSRR